MDLPGDREQRRPRKRILAAHRLRSRSTRPRRTRRSASAARAPDYAGGGGWYKDSVEVSFAANGDPNLSDGSPGSGVNPASLSGAADVRHERLAHGVRHRHRQRRQRLRAGLPDGAGRRDAADARNHLPGLGAGRQRRRARRSPPPTGSRAWRAKPSGTVPIDTSTRRRRDGQHDRRSTTSATKRPSRARPQVGYPTPGAPDAERRGNPRTPTGCSRSHGRAPTRCEYFGLSYTLQHHNADYRRGRRWPAASKRSSYEFSGAGEEEGTWVYRVQGSDPSHGQTTECLAGLGPGRRRRDPAARADRDRPTARPTTRAAAAGTRTASRCPSPPTATRRCPTAAPAAASTRRRSPAAQTFDTSGSHTACGTVADNVGNVSAPGCLTVQVDATPPSLEVNCPAMVAIGASGVHATVTASDGYSGLKTNPSGIGADQHEHSRRRRRSPRTAVSTSASKRPGRARRSSATT